MIEIPFKLIQVNGARLHPDASVEVGAEVDENDPRWCTPIFSIGLKGAPYDKNRMWRQFRPSISSSAINADLRYHDNIVSALENLSWIPKFVSGTFEGMKSQEEKGVLATLAFLKSLRLVTFSMDNSSRGLFMREIRVKFKEYPNVYVARQTFDDLIPKYFVPL